MKFFNWVHKRFHHHHPIPKDECAENVEKTMASIDQEIMSVQVNDKDTQALLKKAGLVDALDGWKDGILTIGTFGLDPLKPFANPNKEYLILDSDYYYDDDDNDDQALHFSLSATDEEDDSSDDDDDANSEDEEENPLMMVSALRQQSVTNDHDDVVHDHDEDKKKGGRTTLADLFMADAEQVKKIKKFGCGKFFGDEDGKYYKKHSLLKSNKGLSFAKKLIPKVKDDASPIKNIQRLMRRMLKRKIHPELLDAKTQKSDDQMAAAGAVELVVSNFVIKKAASESACLLAMQGVPSEV